MSKDNNDLELFISILSLGTVKALINKDIDIDEAQVLLFSPRVLNQLEILGISKGVIKLIHMGTELEDTKDLLPDKYDKYCNDFVKKISKQIKVHEKISYPPYLVETLIKTKEQKGPLPFR